MGIKTRDEKVLFYDLSYKELLKDSIGYLFGGTAIAMSMYTLSLWNNSIAIMLAILGISFSILGSLFFYLSYRNRVRLTTKRLICPLAKKKYFGLVSEIMIIPFSNIEQIKVTKKYRNSKWKAKVVTKVGSDLNIYQSSLYRWDKFMKVLSEILFDAVDIVVIIPQFKESDETDSDEEQVLYLEDSFWKRFRLNMGKYLGIPFLVGCSVLFLILSILFLELVISTMGDEYMQEFIPSMVMNFLTGLIYLFGSCLPGIFYLRNSQLPKITTRGVYPSWPIVKKYRFIPHEDISLVEFLSRAIVFHVVDPKYALGFIKINPRILINHCSDLDEVKKILRELDLYDIE